MPGVNYAMDYGESGDKRDYPQHRRHSAECAAENEKDEALGTLHETHFATGDERFGARA